MSWFFLALLGYFFLAIVFVLDKFILTRSVQQPVVYAFYSTIFMFGAIILWPFGAELLQGQDWAVAALSGLAFGFGLWAMFLAVKRGEASHVNPFIGSVVSIGTFALAALYLGESLKSLQVLGMLVLVFATFLLSVRLTKNGLGLYKGFAWALVAGLLFAVSHTAAKYIYEAYPFLTGFMWTRVFTGVVGLVCLYSSHVRRSFVRPSRGRTMERCKNCGFGKKHAVGTVITDKVAGIVGVVLIQYAIARGSVTLVNAMIGLQYAFMFLLIYLLTRFAPRVFHEKFAPREVSFQIVAIALVILGSALFVVQ
ncbi:MAG: hypothetical protein A3J66_02685 [Candidatus Magasanikbacteria bacterium RIFCSPHIGHO2_02_FULL_47_14]|uniref:EamA domain-containing protein n=1 Tax=Candidatus Magasanikbacteria bacterium RIFCSPHIGHO2_02_FULL_47_14 TaxID=1798680 RepID=A0A1F6M756_9BACT|nr:MAG: hypothetical protein A3J66_02685 [Candidatus Magasanikbacteria bacterium RIFCSPHIGHO2_02_FULL_47_14]